METQRTLENVEIYTDGSCIGNPGRGGWACLLKDSRHSKELYGSAPSTTNNRMEMTAVIAGLDALKRRCRVYVYSDSQYVVNTINCGWARNANRDLWAEIDRLLDKHEVIFIWVKGHKDCPGNLRCDELARNAAIYQTTNLPKVNPEIEQVIL